MRFKWHKSEKDFAEILTAEFLSVTGGLVAGTLLAIYIGKLFLLPGLFILLPGFLEMRGNISGSLAARLGAALHFHRLKPKFELNQTMKSNIIAAFVLAIIVSLALGFFAFIVTALLFKIYAVELIFVAVLAAILSNLIEIPSTAALSILLFKKGHDPDNIMGPYVTTTGDIISVVSLLIAIALIL